MITVIDSIEIANAHKRGLGKLLCVRMYPELMSSIFFYAKGTVCVAMTDGRAIVHKDA